MDMTQSAPAPLVTDPRQRLVVFLFLLTSLFMATLDNQIVSTALPTIVGEFSELERFGWIGSAYLLAMSAVMPIYGKLGDLFGRKYIILVAITLFAFGSVLCGFAWSMNSLIAARVIQGFGGGGIMVSIFSINADLFEPRERAKYQSYTSLVIMASSSLGPILGGTMSDLFGWRSIFLINVPIGIIAVTGLILMLPYRRPTRKPKIDYLGALFLAGTTCSVVLWADSGQIFGSLIGREALMIIALGAVSACIWLFVESRAPEPIVPLTLFRDSTFTLFLVVSLMTGGVAIGMVNYIALYLQMTSGLTPIAAGLFFMCSTVGIVIGSMSAGRLISRTGRYKPFSVLGLTINVISLALMSQLHPGSPLLLVGILMAFQGLAIGFGQQAPIIGVQNSAPRGDVGAATGAVTLTRMGGAAIAISIYGAIIGSNVAHVDLGLPGGINLSELTPKVLSELPDETRQLIGQVYQGAFETLFLTAATIASLGLIAALFLKNVRLPVATDRRA
ncbi:MFS transporter [Rhizobium sp. NTR19]|uniref:MFS transporter n=1 Tax=Neorhizobium turbinariae TaxID=2937795 RepID=A0ABT0IRL3_9HYPH|nr:MDR family MFS transporter [Neorhizobium turbinariae]MCK8780518.1 MFS transporter [Neorhizobium turbinariae]